MEWRARMENSVVRETCSATWLTVSGLMVMGWVSEFSLAGHLALIWLRVLPSWWCMQLSAKTDSNAKDSGSLVGHIMGWCLLFFSPLWIFPGFFLWQHHVPHRDLLLWNSSCKWLSSWQDKLGSFDQWFPNTLAFASLNLSHFLSYVNLDSKFHHFTAFQEWKYPLTPRF